MALGKTVHERMLQMFLLSISSPSVMSCLVRPSVVPMDNTVVPIFTSVRPDNAITTVT